MRRLALLAVVGALWGCPSSNAYLKTVNNFSDTASQSVTALQPASGFRSQLCHLAARYGYVFDRFKGHQSLTLADFETSFAEGKGAFGVKCAAPATSDALVDKALVAIGAYAQALGNVASDDFPGKNITGLAGDVSSLAKSISDTSTASTIAASLSDPVSRIATAIADHYRTKELAEIVAHNDAAVTSLISGIDRYLGAVGEESKDARNQLRAALNAADAVVQPTDLLSYLAISTRRIRELDDIDAAIASSRAALQKLGDAEAKLKAANGKDDAKELADVLGDLTLVINDIQSVRTAIAGKGDN